MMKLRAKRCLTTARTSRQSLATIMLSCTFALGCAGSGKRAQTDFSSTTLGDQIAAGQKLYGSHCAKCHGPDGRNGEAPPLVGADALPEVPGAKSGMREANFRTALDVADFVVEEMPPGQSRRLSIEEHYAVLAYLLSRGETGLAEPLTPSSAPGIQLHP